MGGMKNAPKQFACIFNEGIALDKVGSEIESLRNQITNFTMAYHAMIYRKDKAQIQQEWSDKIFKTILILKRIQLEWRTL